MRPSFRSRKRSLGARRALAGAGALASLAIAGAVLTPVLVTSVNAEPGDDAQITGTQVPDGRDSRFDEPIDLIIENAEQLRQHNAEYDAHPERFDDMTIGIAFTADETLAEGGQAAANADSEHAGETRPMEADCAADRARPSAGQPGQWYQCSGSGHAGAYFVPRDVLPEADLVSQAVADIAALSESVEPGLTEMGYMSAGTNAVRLIGVTARERNQTISLSFAPSVAAIISLEGGGIIDYQEQVLRTVNQHLPGWRTVFAIDGDCEAFALATDQPACAGLTADNLQPRK